MEVVPYGLIHNKKQNIEKNSDRRGGTKMNGSAFVGRRSDTKRTIRPGQE